MNEKEKMKNKTNVLIDSEENLNVDAILQGLVRAKHDAISDYSKERIQNGIKLIIELANCHASAEPRKKGKWLVYGDIPTTCSCCHEDWNKYVNGDVWYSDELPNYCPNCGADMRGEEDE